MSLGKNQSSVLDKKRKRIENKKKGSLKNEFALGNNNYVLGKKWKPKSPDPTPHHMCAARNMARARTRGALRALMSRNGMGKGRTAGSSTPAGPPKEHRAPQLEPLVTDAKQKAGTHPPHPPPHNTPYSDEIWWGAHLPRNTPYCDEILYVPVQPSLRAAFGKKEEAFKKRKRAS